MQFFLRRRSQIFQSYGMFRIVSIASWIEYPSDIQFPRLDATSLLARAKMPSFISQRVRCDVIKNTVLLWTALEHLLVVVPSVMQLLPSETVFLRRCQLDEVEPNSSETEVMWCVTFYVCLHCQSAALWLTWWRQFVTLAFTSNSRTANHISSNCFVSLMKQCWLNLFHRVLRQW